MSIRRKAPSASFSADTVRQLQTVDILNLGTRYVTVYTGEKAPSTLPRCSDTPAAAGAQKWATNPDAVASRICKSVRPAGRG